MAFVAHTLVARTEAALLAAGFVLRARTVVSGGLRQPAADSQARR
ncbi:MULTISPECIES: hypothetical protein [Hydrogenophaga]|nr:MULTISPECIES: hypothetical protein [Hydrogenophaga]